MLDADAGIQDQLTLEYHGPLAEQGRLDSYEVAAYIIAFSDFLGIASRKTYGESVNLKTEVQGFTKDSFDIDFAYYIVYGGLLAATFLNQTPLSIPEFINLIKECIKVFLHLGGKPAKSTTPILGNNSNLFQIENNNGQFMHISGNVINIVSDEKVRKATEQFIKRPLEKDLVYVRLTSKTGGEVAKIDKKDAGSFVPIPIEEPTTENEIPMDLLVESPSFKEGNKWRFYDGQISFHADITDEDFLKKVRSGTERFGKGDRLLATVRFKQSGSGGCLKLERTVIKVLKHELAIPVEDLFKDVPEEEE